MKLYTITTIRDVPVRQLRKDGTWFETEDYRCICVCSNLDTAKEYVENNYGDMYEYGYYPIALIESIESDIVYGGCDREEYWYRWEGDKQNGGYKTIEKPEQWKFIVHWGIG